MTIWKEFHTVYCWAEFDLLVPSFVEHFPGAFVSLELSDNVFHENSCKSSVSHIVSIAENKRNEQNVAISSKLDGQIELKVFSTQFENLSSRVFKVSCYKLPSYTHNEWFILYDSETTRFSNPESQSHDSNLEIQNSRIPYHVTVSHMMTNHLAKLWWEL